LWLSLDENNVNSKQENTIKTTPNPLPKNQSNSSNQQTFLPTLKTSYQQNLNVGISIGSTIKFGSYNWKILDVQGDKALIISKNVTHVNKRYNKKNMDCTWETCTLRQWLNYDFFYKFNRQEQSRICLSTIINEDNQWYGTKGGRNTQDRIFLLSISEVVKYFGDSGQLKDKTLNSKHYISDEYNKERMSSYKKS
jgi:hypothetical protein